MAQISLPDTSVIDLATIQTLVNALNRHDELLTQLAYSYSSIPKGDSGDQESGTFNTIFNIATHEIQFGRYQIPQANSITDHSDGGTGGTTISFERSFKYPPIVSISLRTQFDMYATVNTTTADNFKVLLRSNNSVQHSAWVNWIAIGTRA